MSRLAYTPGRVWLGACVCADEVPRLSKDVAVLRSACVYGFLGGDTKEARASVDSGCVKRGGTHADAFCFAEREGYVGAGERLVTGVKFAVVGNSAAPGGSVWRGRKEVTCCRAVAEEGGDGPHGFR